jgi:hypothetical protein
MLGGGSSINVMAWSHGHKNDWDFFAVEAGDKVWSGGANMPFAPTPQGSTSSAERESLAN